jgi:hypothetical protein
VPFTLVNSAQQQYLAFGALCNLAAFLSPWTAFSSFSSKNGSGGGSTLLFPSFGQATPAAAVEVTRKTPGNT